MDQIRSFGSTGGVSQLRSSKSPRRRGASSSGSPNKGGKSKPPRDTSGGTNDCPLRARLKTLRAQLQPDRDHEDGYESDEWSDADD
jgi:hypothetical protein